MRTIDFNVDLSTPLTTMITSDLVTKSSNNVPLVTLLIRKYYLLLVIYYNYIGTSDPLTSLPILSSTVYQLLILKRTLLMENVTMTTFKILHL